MNSPKYKRKKPTKRRISRKRKNALGVRKIILLILIVLLGAFVYTYRKGIYYYLKTSKEYFSDKRAEKPSWHDIQTVKIIDVHDDCVFGIDVSHYQSTIDWSELDSLYDKKPIDFVFVRSTMGANGVDYKFKHNWRKARAKLFIRGAYHYYRPDENSTKQANNFIKNTPLQAGDFFPVLDIEDYPKNQSVESLRSGVKNWLNIVEKHYKHKPIIYTGAHFYDKVLKGHFDGYPLWIAKYSFQANRMEDHWHFWQFSDKGKVKGISTDVDLNVFNGSRTEIKKLLIQ